MLYHRFTRRLVSSTFIMYRKLFCRTIYVLELSKPGDSLISAKTCRNMAKLVNIRLGGFFHLAGCGLKGGLLIKRQRITGNIDVT